MFYSQFILAKKGPLGTIWIAAHLERKLRKNQVADTDIGVSVDSILAPDVPIALRLSSHLLLGVVRIYSKKVSYLFDDCSDALLKVKQAFRSAAVDLPPEESTAPYHSITLPETFDLDDFELPDAADIFHGNYVDHHVSSREHITLQDTMEGVVFSTSQFGLDERFGDGDTSRLDLDEIDNLSRNAETSGYAQAPCTPGLAEEPNLFTEEASIYYDDHQDLEEPNLSESPVALACEDHRDSEDSKITKLSTDTSNSDLYCGKQNEMIGSLPNDVNPTVVLDRQKTNHMNSLADVASPMQIISFTDDQSVEAITPTPEYLGGNLPLLDGVNGLQNEVTNNNYQQTTCQLGPETLEIDQSSLEPQDGVEISCHLSYSVPSIIVSPSRSCLDNSEEVHTSEDHSDPKVSNLVGHEAVEVMDMHVLQPCKHLNQLSENVTESDVTSAPHLHSEMSLKEALWRNGQAHPLDLSSEVQVRASFEGNGSDFCKMNDQVENVNPIEHQLEISNEKDISGLPALEKLCVAGGHKDDVPVHLLDSTPNREHLEIGDADDARTNIISGKKRCFTESTLTIDSINSIESLGVVQSKRSKGSAPDDNDLLSSILVGKRSSVFKLKSTPHLPLETKTCKKRPRSTARTSSCKKKIIVDEAMVLYGDQIRQQLTHTEDIRRMRKKAPCTRAEIWMIRKEFLEEEIFTEPIFTGFSSDLASMYSQTYDFIDIKVSLNVTRNDFQEAVCSDIPVHPDINLVKETEKEVYNKSLLVNSDMEVQSPERQCPSENLPHEHSVETSEMPTNGEINTNADAINPSTVNGIESVFSTELVSADKVNLPPTASVDLTNSVQLGASDTLHDQMLETQFVEMDASVFNACTENAVDATIGEMDLQENAKLDVDDTCTMVYDLGIETAEVSTHHVEELNSDMKDSPLSHSEHPGIGSTNLQHEVDPDNVFVHCTATTDNGDLEYDIDVHDTGFLNEDDDEFIDEGEDCTPSTEHISAMDNSGWSSRTRAVAKYLQVLFDKEAEVDLPMNSLLVGKTRKEASRMFFEALVLKTRDYIQVEQEAPFGNINMKPRGKLMKADF